jgi:plasmid stabilization system protein ParE
VAASDKPPLIWSPEAIADLEAIWDFYAEAAGPPTDPGPTSQVSIWIPALRSNVKDVAPRPGHERNVLPPHSFIKHV